MEGWPRRVACLCWSFLGRGYNLRRPNVAEPAARLYAGHGVLTNVQRAAANGALVGIPRSGLTPFSGFRPATSDLWVNGLWFTSLSLSSYRTGRGVNERMDSSVHGNPIWIR
ncbi:hypothetical protein ARMSODRAFT_501526 [Armillaria solidipes]|uniref:Uncharacterized protein n=1 Tax=Armillaria solidipes TaxID=1076256 RepID=A0A2H3BW02_9AGAR|nr:hypothetical protein ARMSODRAFT_501526 [Armillaria solidipes]